MGSGIAASGRAWYAQGMWHRALHVFQRQFLRAQRCSTSRRERAKGQGQMYNADCILVEPVSARSSEDSLELEDRDRDHPQQRCSLRQMVLTGETTTLGRLACGTWVCRLQSRVGIQPGGRLRARLDAEGTWHTYEVRRASRALHWSLMVERV